MDIETILKGSGIATAFVAFTHFCGKLLERIKPKYTVKKEVNANYEAQIDFLNREVERLSNDVQELREELRANSRREHRLHLLIHRHCREHPGCSMWFDTEMTKLEVMV